MSTVDNTRVSNSRQWSNYNIPYGKWHPVAVRWSSINNLYPYMTFRPNLFFSEM